MKLVNGFLNLFHRKQRFSPQYATMSRLKKIMFYGLTGFTLSLAASKFVQSQLQFTFEPTEENRLFIKLNQSLERGVYQPNILMVFGIFQWLYARVREEQPYVRSHEQQFEGDKLYWVDLHDKANCSSGKKAKQIPLVLVIAGSQGLDNTLKYILQTTYSLGYRTIALNLTDLYDKRKLGKVIEHIRQKYPRSQMLGVGVQYGANLLINYAAQNQNVFKGLVSIGNPFDLLKSELNLQRSWVWSRLCHNILHEKIKRGQKINKEFNGKNMNSIFEVDKWIYNIEDDKYAEWKNANSCINSIKNIKQTTLFIQSKEDPFTQEVNQDERYENQKCIYVTTRRGGHNEWFQNIWMNRWFTSPLRSFLKLVHQNRIPKIQASQKQTATPSND